MKWDKVRIPKALKDEVKSLVEQKKKWSSMAEFVRTAIEEKLKREKEGT